MKIELLYFDECPGYAELLPRVERLVADRGLTDCLRLVSGSVGRTPTDSQIVAALDSSS